MDGSPYREVSQLALVVKNPPANAGDLRDAGLIPGLGRSPRGGHSNPLQCLPGESHGKKSQVGYSLRGLKKSDMIEPTQHVHHILNTVS